jgi:hypothetical protein
MERDATMATQLERVIVAVLVLLCFPIFVILIALAPYSGFALVLLVMTATTVVGAAFYHQVNRSGVLEAIAVAVLWSLALALPFGLSAILQGFHPAWAAHLIVGALAAGALALRRRAKRPDTIGGPFFFLAAGALIGYLVAALAVPPFVIHQARTLAGKAPYCIQVAGHHGDYVPAETVLDLSGVTMWARHQQVTLGYHAVLAIGSGPQPLLFNWSYRKREWMLLERGPTPVVHCRPEAGFADRLALAFPARAREGDEHTLRLLGRTFVIPAAYQPKASAYNSPSLTFVAVPPDFTPPERPCDDVRDCMPFHVSVYYRPQTVMSWLTTERGQVKENEEDAGGPRATRINCWSSAGSPGSCEHVFLRDGVVYRFAHPHDVLPQWRRLQTKLIDRVRSFQP